MSIASFLIPVRKHRLRRSIGTALGLVLGFHSHFCQASRVANPLFGYTHLLPSPFTIAGGRLVYGTDFAFGLTDFWQVGTNVYRDVFQFYNLNTKLSLFDWESFASALTFGVETYNLKSIDSANPDFRVLSLMPGGVVSFKVADSLAWFVGGNYNYSKTKLVTENITTSGYIRGASGETDLTWAYNMDNDGGEAPPKSKPKAKNRKGGVGNAFSVGASYDFTYKLAGIGLSHHWPGFHIGFHYYPAATKYPVYPIFAGGGAIDF